MDTLFIVLTVLLAFAKLFLYVALIVFVWVLIKKYSPETAESIQNAMPKSKKGDNQSLFFLQLNNRTKIYKTMEAIHWILIIMLVFCSYQLGKSRN